MSAFRWLPLKEDCGRHKTSATLPDPRPDHRAPFRAFEPEDRAHLEHDEQHGQCSETRTHSCRYRALGGMIVITTYLLIGAGRRAAGWLAGSLLRVPDCGVSVSRPNHAPSWHLAILGTNNQKSWSLIAAPAQDKLQVDLFELDHLVRGLRDQSMWRERKLTTV